MKKRLLSILMALALCLGLLPTAALAAGTGYTVLEGDCGSNENSDEAPGKLVDGDITTKWCVTNFDELFSSEKPCCIIFKTSEAMTVAGYSITTGNDNEQNTGRNPKSWTLYGSTETSNPGKDSTSWQVIHSVTNDTILKDKNTTSYDYFFEKTETAYQYFKLEITATKGSDVMQMSEFSLTSCDHTWSVPVTTAPTCTTPGDTRKTCSICNGVMIYDYQEKLGHDFTGEGGKCTRCNKTEIEANTYSYLDAHGETQACVRPTEITSIDRTWTGTTESPGWYVVTGEVEINSRVTVTGDVHLILTDGCELTVNGGIQVQDNDYNPSTPSPNALTVYAQSTGSSMGKLTARNAGKNAAIGGNDGGSDLGGYGGDITINGGVVQAYGGHGAGIGGGGCNLVGGRGGNVTINGGVVQASGSLGAGIGGGGGWEGPGGGGGILTINGGTVTAESTGANGIGGGKGDLEYGGSGTFRTDNGNAVIFASSIADQSGKGENASNPWSGIIFEGSEGKVYGSTVTPIENFTIPDGKKLTIENGKILTIPEGVTMTNEGTVENSGSIYVDGTLSGTVGGNVYYPLTLTNCTGGENTSTVSGKTYGKKGANVTLTATLSDNQLVTSWNVTGAEGSPSDNSYTISSMPATPVTATANLVNALTITTQPTGGTITYGQTATLTVAAKNYLNTTDGLTYQWYQVEGKTETALNGETSSTLSRSGLTVGTYTYCCKVTYSGITVTSSSATVEVGQKEIGIQWGDTTLTYTGAEQQPTATATGTVTGDTISLTVTGAQTNAGTYTATVSRIDGDKAGNYKLPTVTTTEFTITKAEQTAPTPTVKSKTYNSVTLNDIEDSTQSGAKAQYSMDGGNTWQDSPVFTGLRSTTEYSFVARYGETDNYFASPASEPVTVRTNKVPASTYPPAVEQSEGGTVTVSPSYPAAGATVTITATPDEGYEVDQVIVTDKNGDPVEVTNNGDGTYSFTQPSGKVTISVTFAEIQQPGRTPFADVPADAYYYDAVQWAVEKGITDGTSDTTFSPNAPCTRAQIVTFLWRAAGCPEPESLSSFSDVPADSYYAKAVAWAVEQGITMGTGDGTFSPDATCTRAQSVTFLWRSQNAPAAGSGTAFGDVQSGDYYADAVQWAVENGVTLGTSDTTFSPGDTCTRGQIVTFLYRCLVGE